MSQDHYNRGGLIAFLGSITFVFLFFIYICFIHPGVDLKQNLENPGDRTPVVAEAPPPDPAKFPEPWKENPELAAYGKKLFMQNCSMCHGNEGKGDGPAGVALNPRPRNLTAGPWKKGGGFIGWFTVLQHGIEGSSMASYAHIKPFDRWCLVQFINSITNAKVQEDPQKVADFAKTAQ